MPSEVGSPVALQPQVSQGSLKLGIIAIQKNFMSVAILHAPELLVFFLEEVKVPRVVGLDHVVVEELKVL